ncbi:MAG: ATP-binding protein [Actinomycetota bacterium]
MFKRLFSRFIFPGWDGGGDETVQQQDRYWRMWRNTVLAVSAVSLIPLVFMTAVNYYQFQRAFRVEMVHPVERLTSAAKRSLESFLEERIGLLRYIVERESIETLSDQAQVEEIHRRMKTAFGGVVDIGLIDATGLQCCYSGPYGLRGKHYGDYAWFNEVATRGVHVSDVFLGHRHIPHFVIAVRKELEGGGFYVLRATVDTEVLSQRLRSLGLKQGQDVFIVNRTGVLQTPSRLLGDVLSGTGFRVPANVGEAEIIEDFSIGGESYLMGSAYIGQSPFVFVVLVKTQDLMRGWLSIRTEFLDFLAASMVVTVVLIMFITSAWVRRIRDADLRRQATQHSAEHTNKMALIGRLAAGVAHEINNPLAIINEKAGLMRDIIQADGADRKEKILKQVDSIINSVQRCSNITHRLLGFAKHMDLRAEPIALDTLIREVLVFLEKEASYRRITITVDAEAALPTIESDRGQLQQLFLNIINNALDAMSENGRLEIRLESRGREAVSVTIKDDGCGIPKQDLDRIFEPFFSRKSQGTGLGLSISYGIVEKLGGRISVASEVGQGTVFTIVLPVKRH